MQTIFSAIATFTQRHCALGGALRELSLDLAALVWPVACVGCGRPDRDLCAECTRVVLDGDPARVQQVSGVGVPCFAAGVYDGPLKAALLAYKHGGAFGFVRPLGRRLSKPLLRALGGDAVLPRVGNEPGRARPILVPLPSRTQRVRERGWKHVDELVRVALRSGGISAAQRSALRALPQRTGQVGLDAVRRERNAKLIAVRRRAVRSLLGRPVILVDDIVTTGATVRAAVGVLEAAGVEVVAAVALCTAVRRDSPQKQSGTSQVKEGNVRERRSGAPHRPTRLSHLGGRHGRQHPR